jgi:hypothetical protein
LKELTVVNDGSAIGSMFLLDFWWLGRRVNQYGAALDPARFVDLRGS